MTLMARQNGSIRWLAFVGRLFLVVWSTGWLVGAEERTAPASAAEATERADALRAEIAHHDELYFKKAAPEISDYEYDRLKRELAALEKSHPELARDGVVVGDDRSGLFPAYRHHQRMLSLGKSYSESELRAFDARLTRQLGAQTLEYVVEPKFDGLAISVTYEHGRLVRAVTRGNGDEGDEVTANVLTIRALPRTLRAKTAEGTANPLPDLIELRGEVYVGFAEFARINRERENAGETAFANPRNLAAGTLKQTDSTVTAGRRLEIVFYGHGACEPGAAGPHSQTDLLQQLHAWGLPTVEHPRLVQGPDAMWQAVQAIGRERAGYPFPTDGAVVKLNDGAQQRQLGETSQAPLWAMAFKFAPDQAGTRLKAITWQIGRTGVLTPVAELEPVRLGGSTVARATLHNRDEIARRDLRVGDYVFVEKAGEIIPAITGVDLSRRTAESAPCAFPTACPECRTALVQLPGGAAVRCPNSVCPAQVKRRIEHFASAEGVNISGLGPALSGKLVDKGWVRNVADLYRLRREDLLTLGTKVEKSTDRLLAEIEKSKRAELWRFINGMGIPQIGEATARDLAKQFGGLEALARAERKDFPSAARSGGAVQSLLSYLAQPENRAIVQALLDAGVRPSLVEGRVAEKGTIAGKVFVLTGTLPNLTRAQATEKIVSAGGAVASSVTRKTDYVVAGEDSGAKLEAARSLGVPVIGEAELLQMLIVP
jgi:DNA ligase (NAD+)